jgi:hypothetical protein
MQSARSVAFAGLFSAVGRYKLQLLKGPLAFVVGVPEFLAWESVAKHNIMGTAMSMWQLGPIREPHLVEPARGWYGMPHRQRNLFFVAQFLFLNDTDMRKLQSERVPEWKRQLEEELHPAQRRAIEACIESFDIDQWESVAFPDGKKGWRQRRTEQQTKEADRALEEANDTILVINLSLRCRELFASGNLMEGDRLDRFWTDVQKVSKFIDERQEPIQKSTDSPIEQQFEMDDPAMMRRSAMNGTMGGIAVLLLRYPAYLDANRSRKAWVLRQLRRIPKVQLPRSIFDSAYPDETNDDRWECFFAEIVVHFLRQNPSSITWQYQAANLATGFHHSPARHLFAAAYRHRAELDGVFEELCHLLLRWSAVRWHWEHARNGWQINVDVQAEWRRNVDDFLMGRLAGPLPGFCDLAATPRELPDKPAPPERFRHGLDLHTISAAFQNIMRLDEAHSEEERARWLLFWRNFLIWRLGPEENKDNSGGEEVDDDRDDNERWPRNKNPYPSDRWLLERIAGQILQLRPTENQQLFWQPILDLVPALHSWTEDFLTSLFLDVLGLEPAPTTFGPMWGAMLDYASNSPRWAKANDDTWTHLLGFDHLLYNSWEMRHSPLLLLAQPFLEWFVRNKMRSGWTMRELFGLLKRPAAEEIRLKFLAAFSDAVKKCPRLLGHDEDPKAAATFLDFCFRSHQSAIMGGSELFNAFTQFLGALVAVQEPLAFELQDRLRRG